MKLYVTFTSPYARLARIVVAEKALEGRVEIVKAATRMSDSPYYQINPSGRVPYLIDDEGNGIEDSQLICAYLDGLEGDPHLHPKTPQDEWRHRRLEALARSMCDGLAVWAREMGRPTNEQSPTTLAHEAARSQRMADLFEQRVRDPLLQGPPLMAHVVLAVAIEFGISRKLGDLTVGRPTLAAWTKRMRDFPPMRATAW